MMQSDNHIEWQNYIMTSHGITLYHTFFTGRYRYRIMKYKPRTPQHRIHTHALGLSKKQIKRYAIVALLGVWFLMYVMYYFQDTCHGAWHTELLCAEYKAGNIGGHLCNDLCVKKTIYLSSCDRDGHGNLVFFVNRTRSVKLRDRHPLGTSRPPTSFTHLYQSPERGTSMDQFRGMLAGHLRSRLGTQSEHTDLVQQLLNLADVNKDDKVSLAEAKTLMALLKQNEILLLQILDDHDHIPRLESFCGEAYLLNAYPYHKYLYNRPQTGFFSYVTPGLYTWGFPSWVSRAKIAVGLFDFVLDVYQHQSDGSFYLCSLNESNVGYSIHHDVVIKNLADVVPKRMLEAYVQDIHCTTDSLCRYTDHCTTICDQKTNRCTGELVQPNLSLVCRILRPYILPDIPKVIRADFLNLISRCSNLHTKDVDFEVQHSLIVNDLKSLLWRHISVDI